MIDVENDIVDHTIFIIEMAGGISRAIELHRILKSQMYFCIANDCVSMLCGIYRRTYYNVAQPTKKSINRKWRDWRFMLYCCQPRSSGYVFLYTAM